MKNQICMLKKKEEALLNELSFISIFKNLFRFYFFNWSIVDLQCCVNFCPQQSTSALHKNILLKLSLKPERLFIKFKRFQEVLALTQAIKIPIFPQRLRRI